MPYLDRIDICHLYIEIDPRKNIHANIVESLLARSWHKDIEYYMYVQNVLS